MILGTAASLPVVACVATRDRWGHVLVCPYCDETHRHGGHGPTSPAGAINDARMAHCRQFSDEGAYYILFEVPGYTSNARSDDGLRVLNKVTYEVDRMPDLKDLLAEFTAYYELVWAGLHKRGPMRPGFSYKPFLDGKTVWGYAYRGAGPIRPGARLFRDRTGSSKRGAEVRRFWQFIEERAKGGDWLAEDIRRDAAFPAEALDFDQWAEHLGAFADSEYWESDLERLWDGFQQGEPSRQRIEINDGAFMLVDSWRNHCVVLVDRDAVGMYGQDISAEVKEALAAFNEPTREMFQRLGYRDSWMHLASGNWYNLHVPITYREVAVSAMTAAEVNGDAGPLKALHALIAKGASSAAAGEATVETVAIYQWFDGAGTPIYYGITKDMHSRQSRHARYGAWGAFAVSCQVVRTDSREEAQRLERELIERDRPIFNRQYNNTPEAYERLVNYLTDHARLDLLTP